MERVASLLDVIELSGIIHIALVGVIAGATSIVIIKNNHKAIITILFWMYVSFLIETTILSRTPGSVTEIRLTPFWTYATIIKYKDMYLFFEIILNIFLFIPLGLFLPVIIERQITVKIIVFVGVFVSTSVEILQCITNTGLCEIDDIIHNTVGSMIGYLLYKMWVGYKKYKVLGKNKFN